MLLASTNAVDQIYHYAGVALVVRTSGSELPDEAKKSLAKLGLNKMYQARMINLNPANATFDTRDVGKKFRHLRTNLSGHINKILITQEKGSPFLKSGPCIWTFPK